MKVEGVDIKVQIDVGPGPISFVTVTAHIQDDLGGEFHGDLEISNRLSFNTNDSDELNRLLENHPLYLLAECESPAEVWFYMFAFEKIPGLRPQVPIGPYRTDFGIPDKKIAIEIDGHKFHKTQEQRTNDAKRERYMQLNGWRIIRFTGLEVYRDRLACLEEAAKLIQSFGG